MHKEEFLSLCFTSQVILSKKMQNKKLNFLPVLS